MFGTGQLVELAAERTLRRQSGIEQAQPEFHAQDPRHCVIKTRHRDFAGANLRNRVGVDGAPGVGRHEHVETGIDGGGAAVIAAAGHFAVAIPVADDKAVEAQALLEHAGQQTLIAVHLLAVPTGERGHHGLRAGLQRGDVAGAMHVAQFGFRHLRVAFVLAARGTAITDEMLG